VALAPPVASVVQQESGPLMLLGLVSGEQPLRRRRRRFGPSERQRRCE